MSVNEKMTAVADNIRDKTGGTEALTLDEMASGVNEVYEAGKKAEYNEFWDNVGTRAEYRFAGTAWNKKTFRPTKNFVVDRYCFYYHNWQGSAYDLAEHLEELDITMTMGEYARLESFRLAWFTRLPELDFSGCSGTFDRVFYGDSVLVTIDKIILPLEGNVTSYNTPFHNCTRLKNITFEGVIDRSLSFSDSPLTVESMKSIISCLKDYSVEAPFTYTLTLKDSCKTELEANTETVEWNGQNYTCFELITAKGWNLA